MKSWPPLIDPAVWFQVAWRALHRPVSWTCQLVVQLVGATVLFPHLAHFRTWPSMSPSACLNHRLNCHSPSTYLLQQAQQASPP
ncbi:uncharacterized protein PSFLO_06784 [Pseudozyma flocculosa]|uniref:Uncharacterized protein n=1 Tax=Pseudozyma flocculosa TaxID=84751 RepID=A0A5C3FA49_9BASI|nr:uncharacterized protein PSFLO_06784 [Pseudozyma flocculosa]